MLHKFQLLSLSAGEEYRGISVTNRHHYGGFFFSFLAVQGRFVFNPTHRKKPVAKLILTALGMKCEYAVKSLKARWWEEVLQRSASGRWRPGDLCKGISKFKGTCAQLLLSYPEGLHQPPRMSPIVLALQRTSQCLFLLNCKRLSPEIWCRTRALSVITTV